MPQPDFRQFYSEELSNFAIANYQADKNFIASQVFPVVEVDRQSAQYNVWDRNAFYRDEMQLRAPSSESAGSGFSLSQDNYLCAVNALHKDLSNQERANWTSRTTSPDRAIARYLTQQALQRRERQWVTRYFATSIWGQDYTGVASAPSTNQFLQWNDTNADPAKDIKTAKTNRLQNTGFEPNTLVVGYEVHQQLSEHPDIISRISGGSNPTNPAIVTTAALAAIFEVDRYLVARAVKATNVEGATAAYGFIHGKAALLCYVDPNPGPEVPTAGVTFAWTGGDMMGMTMAVAAIEAPLIKSVRYEIEMAWDDKVTANELGAYFTTAVA